MVNRRLLQGGGALGAYQAGAFAALSEDGIEPDWIAGVSIGATPALSQAETDRLT